MYQSDIIAALALAEPGGTPAAAVSAAWTALQAAITAWQGIHAISSQSLGTGPQQSYFEGAAAQMVSIRYQVYLRALAAEDDGTPAAMHREPRGHTFDFSPRHVPD